MRNSLRRIIKHKRPVIVGFLCGGSLGIVSVALAAEADSGVVQTPYVNGHIYDSTSSIYTNQPGSPSDIAGTDLYTQQGNNVPAGWMATDARKFRNGNLCEQTGYQLNNNSTNFQYVEAASTPCGSGTYYSYGLIDVWNGNGYNGYYSGLSPSLNG